jgi:hypothetical protein
MFDLQVFGVSAVGTIMAVVELLKESGFPRKYVPLVSVFLGILIGVFVVDHDLVNGLIDGLSLGLSAIGVHSGVKNVREGVLDWLKKREAAKKEQPQK